MAPGSPLHLTDKGTRISEKLDAKAWADRISESLKDRVQDKQPYDVQDICFDDVRNELTLDEEQDVPIKTCAFEHGIAAGQVLDVLAVELRDKLLNRED